MMAFTSGVMTLLVTAPSPMVLQSYTRCELELVTQENAQPLSKAASGPFHVTFIRNGSNRDDWSAWGHLDDAVHRAADDPFPVDASTVGRSTHLRWRIHESLVEGEIQWSSDDQSVGEMHATVTGHHYIKTPYAVSGKCMLDRKPATSGTSGILQ